MNPQRWSQIDQAFHEIASLEDAEREARLQELAADDPELAQEVRSLLDAETGRIGNIVAEAAADLESPVEGRADDPVLGLRFGPFQAERLLGIGGMGAVYVGKRRDGEFDQKVALKVVRTALISDESKARFLAERRILAGLRHDGIARLIDGGLADDDLTPWFAMEYVEGRPVNEALADASLERKLRAFLDICEAVRHAHRNLVVHRDLKPSNVLVDEHGSVKLLDFGIAKILTPEDESDPQADDLTRDGAQPMTPSYAAPEQLKNATVTTAVDVYCLGVLLYELIAGRHPFDAERKSGELRQAILESTPIRPSRTTAAPQIQSSDLSGDLDNICLMALRKEPERRYGSVADLADDLRRFLGRRPVRATHDSGLYRLRKFFDRHRIPALITAAAGIVVVVLTALFGLRLAEERDLAQAESKKASMTADFLVELFSAVDPSQAQGREITAGELLDRGVERIRRDLTDEPEVRSDLLYVMGDVHKRLGLYETSLELLQEAADVDEDLGTERSADRARALFRIGEVRLYEEQFDAAEQSLRAALDLQRRVLAAPSAEVAETLDLLGRLERLRRRPDEAEVLHQEALEIRLELFDDESLPVSESLQSLASLRIHQSRLEDAVELTRRAIAIRMKQLGEHHPETLELQQNLAVALQRTGDLEEAFQVLNEILPGIRDVYGEDHQNLGWTFNSMAYSLQQLGRIEEAIQHDHKAVEVFRKRGASPAGVTPLVQLARHLSAAGRLTEAETAAREALVWLGDTPENPDPKRSNVLVDLGTILTRQGRFEEAGEALRETLRLDIDTYGEDHPYVAQDRYKLGDLALAAGRPAEALPWLDQAIERQRRLRPGAVALGLSLTSRGHALLALERVAEAEAAFRDAMEVFKVETPEAHPDFEAARRGLQSALSTSSPPPSP